MRAKRWGTSPELPKGIREVVGQRVLATLVAHLPRDLSLWAVVHPIDRAVQDVVLGGEGLQVLGHDFLQKGACECTFAAALREDAGEDLLIHLRLVGAIHEAGEQVELLRRALLLRPLGLELLVVPPLPEEVCPHPLNQVVRADLDEPCLPHQELLHERGPMDREEVLDTLRQGGLLSSSSSSSLLFVPSAESCPASAAPKRA